MEKIEVTNNIKTENWLKFVSFHNLELWDVKRYLGKSLSQKDGYVSLKSILTPFKRKMSRKEIFQNNYKIISKINFSGELFLREFDEINTYKGSLFLVPKNALIFSKINARHGCIYFHQEEKSFVVSSEYPVFKVDLSKVDGEYLNQYLRSPRLKAHLNSRTTGISKARIKSREFLSIPFPLKPIEEQKKNITNYKLKIKKSETAKNDAKGLNAEVINFFQKSLDVKSKVQSGSNNYGITFIRYKALSRWAISYIKNSKTFDLSTCKYEVRKLKSIITLFEGGKTPPTSNKHYWNGTICWTSPKDFDGLEIFDSQDKITSAAVNDGIKVYPDGTILGVFRSGILRHSFPIAITRIPTAINQDLKAMDVNSELISKDYFLFYLHVFQKMVLELASKVGVTVESINSNEFLEIPVIVPPLSVQNKLVKEVKSFLSRIATLETEGEKVKEEAIIEFEQTIF